MSAADVLVDGFPHGTPDGFKQGCKSSGLCPNRDQANLMTCVQANIRYGHDLAYRQAVKDGTATAELEQFRDRMTAAVVAAVPTPADEPVKRGPWTTQPIARPKPTPPQPKTTAGPFSGPGWPEAAAAGAEVVETVAAAAAEDAPTLEEPTVPPTAHEQLIAEAAAGHHGTERGYTDGCRRGDDCPAARLGGASCQQIKADMNRRYREKQREKQRAEALQAEQATVPAPTTNTTGAEQELDATIAELRRQLAAKDEKLRARDADLEQQRREIALQGANIPALEARLDEVLTRNEHLRGGLEASGEAVHIASRQAEDALELLRAEQASAHVQAASSSVPPAPRVPGTLVVEQLPDGAIAIQFDRVTRTHLTFAS